MITNVDHNPSYSRGDDSSNKSFAESVKSFLRSSSSVKVLDSPFKKIDKPLSQRLTEIDQVHVPESKYIKAKNALKEAVKTVYASNSVFATLSKLSLVTAALLFVAVPLTGGLALPFALAALSSTVFFAAMEIENTKVKERNKEVDVPEDHSEIESQGDTSSIADEAESEEKASIKDGYNQYVDNDESAISLGEFNRIKEGNTKPSGGYHQYTDEEDNESISFAEFNRLKEEDSEFSSSESSSESDSELSESDFMPTLTEEEKAKEQMIAHLTAKVEKKGVEKFNQQLGSTLTMKEGKLSLEAKNIIYLDAGAYKKAFADKSSGIVMMLFNTAKETESEKKSYEVLTKEADNNKKIGKLNKLGKLENVVPVKMLKNPATGEMGTLAVKLGSEGSAKRCWKNMDAPVRKKLILDCFRGTKSLHTNKLLHLDIKASNMFINKEDDKYTGMVGDFGTVLETGNNKQKLIAMNFMTLPPSIGMEATKRFNEQTDQTGPIEHANIDEYFDPSVDTWQFAFMLCQLAREGNSALEFDADTEAASVCAVWNRPNMEQINQAHEEIKNELTEDIAGIDAALSLLELGSQRDQLELIVQQKKQELEALIEGQKNYPKATTKEELAARKTMKNVNQQVVQRARQNAVEKFINDTFPQNDPDTQKPLRDLVSDMMKFNYKERPGDEEVYKRLEALSPKVFSLPLSDLSI